MNTPHDKTKWWVSGAFGIMYGNTPVGLLALVVVGGIYLLFR